MFDAEFADDAQPIILSLTDFGAKPDSEEDAQPAMRLAIEAAGRTRGPVVLRCPKGQYHFFPQQASREAYYVTNTASETENPDATKTIGLLIKNQSRLKLDGEGSLFIFHGKQTMLLLDHCKDVEICNLHLDYALPTVTEMTAAGCGEEYCDFTVHPDSRYELLDGKLNWVGEGWRFTDGPVQVFDPVSDTTWRTGGLERVLRTEELAPGRLRCYFAAGDRPNLAQGTVLQMRDGIRDQVGVLLLSSANIAFSRVGIHFMHGLGVVGQFSKNLRFHGLELAPRPETGRTVTGFADFIHLSGCGGVVEITDCRFAGAHDDAVNVHGTYLRIEDRPAPNRIVVRFMHPQTYGFAAFHPGDELEFVHSGTLEACGSGRVASVEALSPRELLLTLEEPVSEKLDSRYVVENVTWTPEVLIARNHFSRIPTRGVLVTTRRRSVIRDNVFFKTTMSAILVAADARSWFESGRVEQLEISGNRFVECGGREEPIIHIAPENEGGPPVHRNITIEGNRFEAATPPVPPVPPVLTARSTSGLIFRNNEILAASGKEPPLEPAECTRLSDCPGAVVAGNRTGNRLG